VALKGRANKGLCVEEEVRALLNFMTLMCVKVYFCCLVEGDYVRDFRGPGV
jgi:hypothetical protein